jgi:putative tryptophan/tyrosine transport system substrate-binding protein
MRRRDFIKGIVGSATVWPLAARAQQAERMRRIGVLVPFADDDAEAKTWLAAFQQGLHALGWEQNRNIRIVYRWTAGDPIRRSTYATELVEMGSDLLFVAGSPELAELHRRTATAPIVFVQVSDPVNLGIIANLAHPGGNITGYANFEHSVGAKWLSLLKDTVPNVSRVAIIFDPQNLAMTPYLEAVKAAAPSFGIQLTLADVRGANDIGRAIGAFAQEPGGGMIVLPNAVTVLHRDLIIALATRYKLPAIYSYRLFTRSGGFISYGVDLGDQYRQAASYVDLILKGRKPGDLPVQFPTKYVLVVNLKAAKALGLTIPEPFLQTADEVIE